MSVAKWAAVVVAVALAALAAPHGAASHEATGEISWACGGGGGGQRGHPDSCGINAINEPTFGEAWIDGGDRVMGVVVNGDARAYPVSVLTRHEIVNDVIGGVPVAVTFCPLCGSGITFDATVAGTVRTFTPSGFLFAHDLVMMDAETSTLWTQIRGDAIATLVDSRVHADHPNLSLRFVPSVISTWRDWQAAHPETLLLAPPLAAASYANDPYSGGFGRGSYYESCEQGISGRGDCDIAGLHPKQLVLGVAGDGDVVAYPLDAVAQAGGVVVDRGYLVVALGGGTTGHAWHDGGYNFTPGDGGTWQADGTTWDLATGTADDGRQLARVAGATTLFWFAWQEHRPTTDLWVPASYQPSLPPEAATPGLGASGLLAGLLVAALAMAYKARRR